MSHTETNEVKQIDIWNIAMKHSLWSIYRTEKLHCEGLGKQVYLLNSLLMYVLTYSIMIDKGDQSSTCQPLKPRTPHIHLLSSFNSFVRRRCMLLASISCSYRTATPAFDVRSSGLFSVRPGGLELVTRLPARSVTFRWQFSQGTENFHFLVLQAYTAH